MKAMLPADEDARIRDLRAFEVLDTPSERTYDEIVGLAYQICGTPIAVMTLIDVDRQWFKAKVGLDIDETDREVRAPRRAGGSARSPGRSSSSAPRTSATSSYSYWRVGQCHDFGGYEGVAQGPIHFAGEHTSIDFQGYMEGGAETGIRAANEVIEAVR